MANKNKTKTPEQIQYDKIQKKHELKRPILKNCIRA
ncbi:MAG: stage V sporulation protein AC, partial [Heyndrickxia sp.]